MAEPLLERAQTGTTVRQLQEALKGLGYDPGPVDGSFGDKTETAVKKLQQDQGIAADGIVGPETWAKIDALEDRGLARVRVA